MWQENIISCALHSPSGRVPSIEWHLPTEAAPQNSLLFTTSLQVQCCAIRFFFPVYDVCWDFVIGQCSWGYTSAMCTGLSCNTAPSDYSHFLKYMVKFKNKYFCEDMGSGHSSTRVAGGLIQMLYIAKLHLRFPSNLKRSETFFSSLLSVNYSKTRKSRPICKQTSESCRTAQYKAKDFLPIILHITDIPRIEVVRTPQKSSLSNKFSFRILSVVNGNVINLHCNKL